MGTLVKVEEEKTLFERMYEINVSKKVEKKGNFNYLSWAWAVAALRKASPTATWEVIKHEGLPYCKTECGYFVEVAVTVEGITLSQIHPVLDSRNKTIPVPSAFDINTSIQRCLVKAIALHGLGLYIYAGEDLPDDKPVKAVKTANGVTQGNETKSIAKSVWDELPVKEQLFLNEIATEMINALADDNVIEAHRLFYHNNLDNEEQVALWSRFDSKQRASIKSYNDSLKMKAA